MPLAALEGSPGLPEAAEFTPESAVGLGQLHLGAPSRLLQRTKQGRHQLIEERLLREGQQGGQIELQQPITAKDQILLGAQHRLQTPGVHAGGMIRQPVADCQAEGLIEGARILRNRRSRWTGRRWRG